MTNTGRIFTNSTGWKSVSEKICQFNGLALANQERRHPKQAYSEKHKNNILVFRLTPQNLLHTNYPAIETGKLSLFTHQLPSRKKIHQKKFCIGDKMRLVPLYFRTAIANFALWIINEFSKLRRMRCCGFDCLLPSLFPDSSSI